MHEELTKELCVSSSNAVKTNWSLLYPLNEFYEQSGWPLPTVARVDGRDMPEPYRSLLVHERDMTPTLEEAYGRSIQLRVLRYAKRGHVVSRQVALVPAGSVKPVAFGAIRIDLEHVSPEVRELVLERRQPLGTILREQSVEHAGHPDIFIQVRSDAVINGALQLAGPRLLYGRQNVITDAAQRTLAQVVEILPPSNGISHLEKDRE
jgi:chorismate-pyruvate lyase